MNESKIHVELLFPFGSLYCRTLGRLFLGLSLFLKIDEPKWVVVKIRRCPKNDAGKLVQLVDFRGAETKEP